MSISWTGNLDVDWASLRELWTKCDSVLQSEVGTLWAMPLQHRACVEFPKHYPESKAFLIRQLHDADQRVAAYAFKCLVRVADIKKSDVPAGILARADTVTTFFHHAHTTTTLGEFIAHYFNSYSSRNALLEEQGRSLSWQENELAEWKRHYDRPGQ